MLICFECGSKWTVYFTFGFANCSPFLVCRETANLDLLSLCWVVAIITKCYAVLQLLSSHWENFIVELWIFPGLGAMGFGMPWIKRASIVPFNTLWPDHCNSLFLSFSWPYLWINFLQWKCLNLYFISNFKSPVDDKSVKVTIDFGNGLALSRQ